MNQMKKEELEITISDSDRIECAIRHIQTAVDVDPWAVEIAVEAMEAHLSAKGTTLVSRQAAIDAIQAHKHNVLDAREYDEGVACGYAAAHNHICDVIAILPSAQPEQFNPCTICQEFDCTGCKFRRT